MSEPSADRDSVSRRMARVRAALRQSRAPMLIADDQRCWVTGNAAACAFLGLAPEELPWRTMDDFTPPSDRGRLEAQWAAFLAGGAAEGWYELYLPDRGALPVELSMTANVLPARHLALFLPHERSPINRAEGALAGEDRWASVSVKPEGSDRLLLSSREQEVLTLVATGLTNGEMAERLFVSGETIKSHVQNAMEKLGVHTRAHAVATALVTGQITLSPSSMKLA